MKLRNLSSLLLLSLAAPLLGQQKTEDKKAMKTISTPSSKAWDLALATGASFGTYSSKTTDTKNFGGIALVGDWFSDALMDWGTSSVRASLLVDLQNKQIVRKGIALGESFYLLGGKKRDLDRIKLGTIVSTTRHNLAFPLRLSQNFFSASPVTAGAKDLSGTTINLESGLVYSLNLDSGLSLSFELGLTLLSLSNSVERAKEASTEVLFSARKYL